MRIALPNRHEVDHRHESVWRFEKSFEDESVIQIPPPAWHRIFRGNRPVAVVFCSHQRSETGGRCEMRPAKPVDRALVAYQCCRFAVTDHCVLLDANRHLDLRSTNWQ